jgi:hypothetical protein
MRDYLRELCDSLNIILEYTEGGSIALAGRVKNNTPYMRVNRIFQECPEDVAKAIIGYYTDYRNENEYLLVLDSYIEDNVISVDYIIKPPDEAFKIQFAEHNKEVSSHKEKTAKSKVSGDKPTLKDTVKDKILKENQSNGDISSLIEMEISSIIKKNFLGEISNIIPGETFEALSDDIVELNVIVDDPEI